MRYVELFAGAGGMSMGLEAAGMRPVAHAEIEPHARAVLRHHWPDTPLHGDVTQVDWTQYAGQVDLVAGGSPCQDLSVAGRRAGLAGARSGLFFELIRAWEETGAPYCLWENVDGARSSNGGEDFAAVLSAFVGNPVAVPRDKRGHARWPGAGVAAGSAGVAAWRVLDLQHFGPPQRRRRIFVLAARTGGCDPAEVLALSEGVCGHPSPRQQQRERAATGIGAGTQSRSIAIKGSVIGPSNDAGSQRSMTKDDAMFCLQTNEVHGVVTLGIDGEKNVDVELMGTLNTGSKSGSGQQPAVLAFDTTQITSAANYSNPKPGDPCHPLAAGAHPPAVLAFTPGFVARGEGPRPMQDLVQTLGAYTQGDQAPHVLVTDVNGATTAQTLRGFGHGWQGQHNSTNAVICLASGQANAEVVRDGVPTLNTIHEQPIIVGTLDVHDSVKWGSHQWVAQNKAIAAAGRPRRLTPLECERLMGWPDRHTAQGVKEDGTAYALSDTARYRLCGNGVGAPVAAWIGQRLVAAEASCPP